MNPLYIFAAGLVGGLIRGLVGIAKHVKKSPSKKKKLRKDYMVVSLLTSGGIGLLVGLFIIDDLRFALLAGYAGTDFLESLFKIKMGKKVWD